MFSLYSQVSRGPGRPAAYRANPAIVWLLALSSMLLAGCGGGSAPVEKPQQPVPVADKPAPPPAAPEIRILVVGQSIGSNCNQRAYPESPGVMQVDKAGEIVPARDPFIWADCTGGSMWMPLGQRMIESGFASKVVFMPIGVGGTAVKDWQAGGRAFDKLNSAIALIQQKNIKFDYAFWHQGSSDIGTAPNLYRDGLASVFGYINQRVEIKRWVVALHSRCWGTYDAQIEAVQREFGDAPAQNRVLGPNTNSLGDEFRIDKCHLNSTGQEKMADMWMTALNNAGK